MKINIGIVGLGKAFMLMLPTFLLDERVRLVGATDRDSVALKQFADDFPEAATYDCIEELCKNPEIHLVYICTPHQFHADQAEIALTAGKHVLVEKPMALTYEDCCRMVSCALKARRHLIVGHSHSFDYPIAQARRIISSGRYGQVRFIHSLNYTDFLYRPRRSEELDTSLGGGVIFNQASHQIDIVRSIAQGNVVDLTSYLGEWDSARRTQGAYSALIRFDNDVTANITYSGYSHYNSDEMMDWTSELGIVEKDKRLFQTRLRLGTALKAEGEDFYKRKLSYGRGWTAHSLSTRSERFQHFGHLIISCESADIVPKPDKVEIFTNENYICEFFDSPIVPRKEVIDELEDALSGMPSTFHDGSWAAETLHLCLSLLKGGYEKPS